MIIKAHARQRAHQSSYGNSPVFAENSGAAVLVMIFQEARKAALIRNRRREMRVQVRHPDVADRVVEGFVVDKRKSKIEQPLFRSPVSFGEEDQARNGGVAFAQNSC